MKKVLRWYYVLCLQLMVLSGRCFALQPGLTFTTNQKDQKYVHVLPAVKTIIESIKSNAQHQHHSILAVAAALEEQCEYFPYELMVCAVHDAAGYCDKSSADYVILNSYYRQLLTQDLSYVVDEETARSRCKNFDKLCVKGNVKIGGNLIVCGTIW